MSYGMLCEEMEDAVHRVVEGKIVHDLGAGDLTYSEKLIQLGASRVIAVDGIHYKDWYHNRDISFVEFIQSYFRDYKPREIDVAFTSWPLNAGIWGLPELVERAKTVIYLGRNTGGTSCGTPEFFEKLRRRPILEYIPWEQNSMIVYGPGDVDRGAVGEEFAGLQGYKEYFKTLAEAEEAAQMYNGSRTPIPHLPISQRRESP